MRQTETERLNRCFTFIFLATAATILFSRLFSMYQEWEWERRQESLRELKAESEAERPVLTESYNGLPVSGIALWMKDEDLRKQMVLEAEAAEPEPPEMLEQYKDLYSQNNDMVGWLFIEGTRVDYPVMQTPEDESYYLSYDFYGNPDKNGCLVLDSSSDPGEGLDTPSTNLIIHGHTMKSGAMFGQLKRYADEEYGREHSVIDFDTLYEEREYDLVCAFYSKVYYENDDVFKYYKFFQADTQEELDEWMEGISGLALYMLDDEAELGDEFLTLSCCSYQTDDGRFVVVAKRRKDLTQEE